MKKYVQLYRTGDEFKTIEYDTLEERDELLSKEHDIKPCRTFSVGGITWNTGEEPFDLTKEDVETLVEREIEYIKTRDEIDKYCNRWRWLYIMAAVIFRFPFMILSCAFSIFKIIFELCENCFEWIHEGIDKIANKVFDYPIRDKIEAYFNARNSEDRDTYLVQRNRHDAIFGKENNEQ